jgi:pullulanase
MIMDPDIFYRRSEFFLLWLPGRTDHPPALIIGRLQLGAPVAFVDEHRYELQPLVGAEDLWGIPAGSCALLDGKVYHYWFEVTDAHPHRSGKRIRVTDPMAFTVDWRLLASLPDSPDYRDDDRYPASVVSYSDGRLVPCDSGGEILEDSDATRPATFPPNNRIVIYELPTAWTRIGTAGERDIGVGSFRDVIALIDKDAGGANFADLEVTQAGRSYLTELGINAIELLPPADSFYNRQWGYGTTNFFAPDFELGFPGDYSWPTPNRDLKSLVTTCHRHTIRFFVDVVMAFARNNAYLAASTEEFFILDPKSTPSDPDAHNSRGKDDKNFRDGFGSTLFRYARSEHTYDPVSGRTMSLYPARQLMVTSLLRWINDFRVDGIRMDSVENVGNWEFIGEYKDLARKTWKQRFEEQGNGQGADERFLVVGEELQEPLGILKQHRLDGLWHENFKRYIRAALVGQNADSEPSFEWTVRKAIDCRHFGYQDGAQAVIYLTSHDVQGYRNERLFNFLVNNHIYETEDRIKLGFVCLLTAVGIPMILAGEEFADQHDLFDKDGNVTQEGGKQVDPVNFSRLKEHWRTRIKDYVARLITLRRNSPALAVNDTKFIHVDFDHGKRVLVWRRGGPDSDHIVVVVANFSDYGTPDSSSPHAEYRVSHWPATPPGKKWREVTQDRDVPAEWVGREPIFPWEAKVYVTV